MDLATLASEPVAFRTPRGDLLATSGTVRQVARLQGWLNRQERPAPRNGHAAPVMDLTSRPDPDLPPEYRRALSEQRIALARGLKPDAGGPPDLFDDLPAAFRLVLDSDEAMGLVLAAAFGRHQPEFADPADAVALADDLTYLQFQRAFGLALGLDTGDALPNAPAAAAPADAPAPAAAPTTST